MGERTKKPACKSGWRQWKADEARRVVEAWRASGLPLATFARTCGVAPSRLQWWQRRLGDRDGSGDAPLRLVPAIVTGLPLAAATAVVTLRVASDVVVEIADVAVVPAAWTPRW